MPSLATEHSPEFRLIAEASARAFNETDRNTPPLDSLSSIDWPRFVRTARFHRVQGLVWKALRHAQELLPPKIAGLLKADAEAVAVASLRAAAGSRELLSASEEAGIPLLFVKGLTLGVLAYGSVGVKSAADIDILVAEENVGHAAKLLRSCGYAQVVPPPDKDVSAWHSRRKESLWENARAALYVDLHSRLADNPRLIPTLDVHSPKRWVEVSPGIALPTLAPDELFAYLCVHGASSLWFRLKWITDLAALLHGKDGAEIERLYRRSQELGAGRAPAQALLLADAIYGSLHEVPALRDELAAERVSRWLFRSALKQLTADTIEPTATRFGTFPIHLTQLGLLPGWRFRTSELVRQARAALA